MRVLLNPAITLMRKLSLLPKFAIVCVLFIAPAILVTGLLVKELNKSIAFAEREQIGVQTSMQVQEILRLAQHHRAQRHLALAGNAAALSEAAKIQDDISKKIVALEAPKNGTEKLGVTPAVLELKKSWENLVKKIPSTKGKESYADHSKLVDQIIALNTQVADRSNLTLDPQVEINYLIALYNKSFPELANQIADIAARGAPYIDTALLEPNEDVLINATVLLSTRDIGRIPAQLEATYRENPSFKASLDPQKTVLSLNQEFLERTKNEILSSVNQTSGTEYLKAGLKSVDAWYGFGNAAAGLINNALKTRMERETLQRNLALGAILLCVVVAAYLLAGFYFSFSFEINRLHEAVARVASGDLVTRTNSSGRDEIANLLNAFDGMREILASLVYEIRQGTESIDTASREISLGNADLSSRTEQQANSLQDTASFMRELTETVIQNTRSTNQGNQNAITASSIAKNSGETVNEMITMMEAIQGSSRKISDIIGVIDSIAFQTNILALNAAVEAARAGEQGRGFAVVASEVRNLAQRSAGAAKEIKALISTSVEQVNAGNKQVLAAGNTMEQVLQSIDAVSSNMHAISSATVEQQEDIEHVNQAILRLDEITQQNSALVEEAAAAADSMHQQAVKLGHAVAAFKIDKQVTHVDMQVPAFSHNDIIDDENGDVKRASQNRAKSPQRVRLANSR